VTAAARGPRVVAVGGGHGLAATLRAAHRYAGHTTAVVATADDGGSTGRLRSALDMPAPGDVRRCVEAMAEDNGSALAAALEYRFAGSDVEGHALGNLLLAALHATVDPVVLRAEATGGRRVTGQVAIARTVGVERVMVEPPTARVPDEVVDALAEAHQVVLGPGSLYTSVLAAAVVDDVRDALKRSPGRTVYVCNVRAEAGETRAYDVAAHVGALGRHGIEPDVVVAQRGALAVGDPVVEVVEADVVRPHGLAHDPALLGDVLARLAS
jgi:2-phospho-L-lactate transferase/gluconeogenesis factor (CofD/UPF0052 family)